MTFNIGFYNLRKFGRFIIRLIKWLPVLWKQEDWDYEYIYELMEVKMKELYRCLKEDDIHKNADRHARQILICLEYFKRMRNPTDYFDLPSKDIQFVKGKYGTQIETTKYFKRQIKRSIAFEKFNYEMFWKRFIQWHRSWWC